MTMEHVGLKLKWIAFAAIAVTSTVLAWVYGKRTPAVIRSQLRENQAREKALRLDLSTAETRAQEAAGALEAKAAEAQAVDLQSKLVGLRARRERLILDAAPVTDDAIATSDNRAHSHG